MTQITQSENTPNPKAKFIAVIHAPHMTDRTKIKTYFDMVKKAIPRPHKPQIEKIQKPQLLTISENDETTMEIVETMVDNIQQNITIETTEETTEQNTPVDTPEEIMEQDTLAETIENVTQQKSQQKRISRNDCGNNSKQPEFTKVETIKTIKKN